MELSPQSERALNRGVAQAAEWSAHLYVTNAVDYERLTAGEAAARTKAAEAEIERKIRGSPAAPKIEVDFLTMLGNLPGAF